MTTTAASTIDVAALLGNISPDAPCGDDLSSDPAYTELERLAQGTPERQIGATIVPATEPDWKVLLKRCTELMARTRDLRVSVYLTLALLKLHGPPGLRDGLAIIRGLLERHWENLHPRLDPDDDLDPTERLNILASLATPAGSFGDPIMLERRLREAPLSNSRRLGRFSLRDAAVARGDPKTPSDPGKPKVEASVVEAALDDTPSAELRAADEATAESIEHVKAITAALDDRTGMSAAIDVTRLQAALNEVRAHLKRPLARHGISQAAAGAAAAQAGASNGDDGSGGTAPRDNSGTGDAPEGSAMASLSGEVRSKEDVVQALQKVCDYYERYEPSSPIPLLLKGAQRLVSASFMEIMKHLTPEALTHLTRISGQEESES